MNFKKTLRDWPIVNDEAETPHPGSPCNKKKEETDSYAHLQKELPIRTWDVV